MSRTLILFAGIAALSSGPVAAQSSFATYEDSGATTSTGGRVERVYSVPSYTPYQPDAFQSEAYEAATTPIAPAPAPAQTVAQPSAFGPSVGSAEFQGIDVTPQDGLTEAASYGTVPFSTGPSVDGAGFQGIDVTPQGDPLAAPASASVASDGEIGFRSESETSRLLIALEDTYARRVGELEAEKAARRKALLDQFERDAKDPEKVIGLADRMRAAMADLDTAHAGRLAAEERQYTDAMLKVLDAAPQRTQ